MVADLISAAACAEWDAGTFTCLFGLKGCARVYNQAPVSPAPEGRELEFALTHEAPIGRGVVEMAHSCLRVDVAYRLNW